MRILLGALAAAASIASAASVAQGPPANYTYNAKESDQSLAEYADCLVKNAKNAKRATTFVRALPGTPVANTAAMRLIVPECLRGSMMGQVTMRAKPAAMRPALFAALYRKRFGATEPASFADAPVLTLTPLFDAPAAGLDDGTRAGLALGDCVVRANTGAAHRLVAAKPWSDAEQQAMPAVIEAARGCVSEKTTLRVNRNTIRGVVAEALYHNAVQRAAAAPKVTN